MNNSLLHTQLVRFVIIGLSNTLISYVVFIIAFNNFFPNDAFLSQCVSYLAGIFWSFSWNKKWTFSDKNHAWSLIIPFLVLQLALLFCSAFLMQAANRYLDWNITLIWFCVMGVITIANFLLSKFLIFRA